MFKKTKNKDRANQEQITKFLKRKLNFMLENNSGFFGDIDIEGLSEGSKPNNKTFFKRKKRKSRAENNLEIGDLSC